MRNPIRIIVAVLYTAMTVSYVTRENALDAALCSAVAMGWLWSWMEDA